MKKHRRIEITAVLRRQRLILDRKALHIKEEREEGEEVVTTAELTGPFPEGVRCETVRDDRADEQPPLTGRSKIQRHKSVLARFSNGLRKTADPDDEAVDN